MDKRQPKQDNQGASEVSHSGVQGTESLVFVLVLFSNVFGKCFLAAKLTHELGHKKSHLLFPPLPAQQIILTALEWSSL